MISIEGPVMNTIVRRRRGRSTVLLLMMMMVVVVMMMMMMMMMALDGGTIVPGSSDGVCADCDGTDAAYAAKDCDDGMGHAR